MCIPPAGFEPTIPTSERPNTFALDRAAAGVGSHLDLFIKYAIISALFRCRTKSVAGPSGRTVCGRSPAEIVGLNPTGGVDVCLL